MFNIANTAGAYSTQSLCRKPVPADLWLIKIVNKVSTGELVTLDI